MNKTTLIYLWFCTVGLLLHAQTVLQKETSLPREGDVIVKQELKYKPPGRSGKSVIWDFSELTPLDTEFEERLCGKIDSSLICLSRNGGHKYKVSGDSLLCVGYQNSTQQIDYLSVGLNRIYPMHYLDSIHSFYYGEGVYSRTLPIVVFGETKIQIDAEGVLILPTNIQINHVLRVCETAHVGQRFSSSAAIYSHGDRMRYSTDSLTYHLQNDKITWQITTYKWYAPGYRYPVFETVHTGIMESGNLRPHFNRSYYFPPQSHDYLADDPVNENRLADIRMQEDKQNLRIEPIGGCFTSGFVITTPENVKYIFANMEYTALYGSTYAGPQIANCPGLDSDLIPEPSSYASKNNTSLWRLTRIDYPTGDKIYFDYSSEDYLSPLWQSLRRIDIRCTQCFGDLKSYYSMLPFDGRSISNSIEYHTGSVCLKSIRWKDGRLDFIPGELRKDIRNNTNIGIGKAPKTLGAIQLFKKNGTTPLLTYSFGYSYFSGKDTQGKVTLPDRLRSRLKLTTISLKGTGNATQNYQMEYNDSEPLPQKNSYSCDAWGYYNDSDPTQPYTAFKANFDCYGLEVVNQEIHLSKNKCISKGDVFGEGDKAPNTKALVGMLTALTTPTGGRTEFKYECNRVLDNLEWKKMSAPTFRYLNKEKDEEYVTDTINMPFDGYLDIACSYTGSSDCLEKERTTAIISISNGWRLQGLSASPNQNLETPPRYRYLIREKVECKKGIYQIVLHTQLKESVLSVAIEKYKGTVTAQESIVGGVRIAEIKSPLGVKKFSYTDHAGRSTGRLNRNPPSNRIVRYTEGHYDQKNKIESINGYYIGIEFNSVSLLPMENPYSNYFMGYTAVTTTQESSEENLIEKSYFYNEKDPTAVSLLDPGTVLPLNGNLLEHQIFSNGELLQKTVHNYAYKLLSRELGFRHNGSTAPINYYTPEYFVYTTAVANTRYEKMPNGNRIAYPMLTTYEYSSNNYQARYITEYKGGGRELLQLEPIFVLHEQSSKCNRSWRKTRHICEWISF